MWPLRMRPPICTVNAYHGFLSRHDERRESRQNGPVRSDAPPQRPSRSRILAPGSTKRITATNHAARSTQRGTRPNQIVHSPGSRASGLDPLARSAYRPHHHPQTRPGDVPGRIPTRVGRKIRGNTPPRAPEWYFWRRRLRSVLRKRRSQITGHVAVGQAKFHGCHRRDYWFAFFTRGFKTSA